MARVRDIDKGYRKLLKRVFRSVPAIEVGIHGDEGGGGYSSGATVADVASIHEFGLGNHPQRSFIRAWFDAERSANEAVLVRIGEAVVRRGSEPRVAAERAAVFLENSAKKFIQSGSVAPPTDKDGTTLIETGQLVSSIRGKVVK